MMLTFLEQKMKKTAKTARTIHLSRRSVLEYAGLMLLITISINQHTLIEEAFESIRASNPLLFACGSLVFWLLLPVTSISYRLLARKHLPIGVTMLAQLAGAGPGRIIPGGLGRLSFGTLNLHKLGLSIQRAVIITVTNNVIGLLVHATLFSIILFIHPGVRVVVITHIDARTLLWATIGLLFICGIYGWAIRLRKFQLMLYKLRKQARAVGRDLRSHPIKTFLLIICAIVILFGHVTILMLVGKSIDAQLMFNDAIIALSVGIAVGGILPTPGGIGGVEAGTISILVLLGYDPTTATSATLLFRAITYWQPLIPGTLAYIYLRKRQLL